ncbi:MAG: DNA-binding protein [Thermoprotei archaeon]|nr:DNA-binding protein [Thermoprotei archaeon]
MRVTILMSIKPYFAEKILEGLKRFELRRKVGEIPERSRIVLYASSPMKAIIGEFTVGRVIEGDSNFVWEYVTRIPNSGVSVEDWPYIKGAKVALAIEVLSPRRFKRPLHLEEIRSMIPGFQPPLSYRRLRPGELLLKVINKIR